MKSKKQNTQQIKQKQTHRTENKPVISRFVPGGGISRSGIHEIDGGD